jgi:hypothetical protein
VDGYGGNLHRQEAYLTMSHTEFWHAATHLLTAAGFRGAWSVQPLSGGANNRVFRIHVSGTSVLLKAYFQHRDDPRDRLGTEFAFARFAWDNGIRCLPQPLAYDPQHALGLYEFVEGRPVLSHELTAGMIHQALNFYCALNRHKQLAPARALPIASEACFSLAEHLQCVERRLHKLRQIDATPGINRDATHFIQHELLEAWREVTDAVRQRTGALGVTLEEPIAQQDRRLSPADFGFHNALVHDTDQLRFIDFEYAGWDDPAKIVCDFLCQPAVPVPLDYYDMCVKTVVADLSEPDMYVQRIALVLPVHQIKWCCILLNAFLPLGHARHHFARPTVDQDTQKAAQLEKARHTLQRLTGPCAGSFASASPLLQP